jgi:D-3-phosphoglycerate dehydrogenase
MTNAQKFSVVAVAPAYRNYAEEEKTLAPLDIKVREVVTQGDAAKLKQVLEEVDIVFLRDTPLNGEIIKHMRRCKGIVRYGVGVDTVDLKAATEQKIIVANVPNYDAEIEVSDHAAALTLALLWRIPSRHLKVTQKGIWRLDQEEPITRIGQRVLGLLGFGKIAQAYLARMRGFGIRNVMAYDPYTPDEVFAAQGVKKVDIDTLCRTTDLISIHAPAMPETKHIVNTSRGALVDEAALVDALRQHKIFGAALDVQEKEPMSADSPLQAVKEFENVILTNHMDWYSEESAVVLQRKAGGQGYQILATGNPTNWVNRW